MDSVTPGDVNASTPGNTDRVTAALNAARARIDAAWDADVNDLDDPEFFAPPAPVAAPVREITPEDARDAVKRSTDAQRKAKRAAAVDVERERLTAQRAKRADAVAAHKVTRARRKLDRDAVREATAAHVMGSAGVESGTAPLPLTDDMRAAVLAFYADGGSKSPEVVAVESAAERRGMVSGTSGDVVKAAHEWARITDGKCAVVVPADAVDESLHGPAGVDADGNITVTLSGRMHMDKAVAVCDVIKVDILAGVVQVGKSAGALAPVPGSDADGITGTSGVKGKSGHTGGIHGVCPVCRTVVKLTNSGAVGTHRPDGSTPDAPQLSAREIPAVDVHGEATRDAAKLREREAEGDDDTSRRKVAASDKFSAERSGVKGLRGSRNMGALDGVAMVPRGESGYAGMRFDDGESVDLDGNVIKVQAPTSEIDPVVGGVFGDRRQSEYDAMSKAQRRRYRAKVARNRAVWEAGRDKRKAQRAAQGMPRSDMRAARKAAAVGSSRQGHTHSHHLASKHTDTVVTPVGGAPRMGRDWTSGK
jgi:hypothetical protein